jgi:pyridoxine kinase
MTQPPVTYVIAGSEATGGAGVQADLRTLQEYGVYGAATLTCLVSFDPEDGWNHRFVPVDAQTIRDQAQATLADWAPASVKIGMLGTVETIRTVRDILAAAKLPNVVCDPVLICKGQEPGAALDIDTALRAEVLPLADLITPNYFETCTLAGVASIDSLEALGDAAKRIADESGTAVLAKGGLSIPGDDAVDILWDGAELVRYARPKVAGAAVSGAGDSLATAVAAGLASGASLRDAIESAKQFVTDGIRRRISAKTPFDVVWQSAR